MDSKEKKSRSFVSAAEEEDVTRKVLKWLNGCPNLPAGALRYVLLEAGIPNMSLRISQSPYKVAEYILGGYQAQLKCSIVYRVQPGDSGNERLKADAALNAAADWASDPENAPQLGDKYKNVTVKQESRARLIAAWDTGDEDHSVELNLTYEVF